MITMKKTGRLIKFEEPFIYPENGIIPLLSTCWKN